MIGTATPREQWMNGLALTAFLAMAFATILLTGCTKQEKVLDVETPGGSIEVYEEKPISE